MNSDICMTPCKLSGTFLRNLWSTIVPSYSDALWPDRRVCSQPLMVWIRWFRSNHLSRLGWSRLAHRWGCSNLCQLALMIMYSQITEDHYYLWLHSYKDLKWRCWCVVKTGEHFGRKMEELSLLAAISVKTTNKKSVGMWSWFLGICLPTFMLIFPLHMKHTHTKKQSTALILVWHLGASSQLEFIHSKWAVNITQMQPHAAQVRKRSL